jgi:hypothetical protein
MRPAVWLALTAVVAGMIMACGQSGQGSVGRKAIVPPVPTVPVDAPPPSDGAHDAALAAWRRFPATRVRGRSC